jgi:hypothetical protein
MVRGCIYPASIRMRQLLLYILLVSHDIRLENGQPHILRPFWLIEIPTVLRNCPILNVNWGKSSSKFRTRITGTIKCRRLPGWCNEGKPTAQSECKLMSGRIFWQVHNTDRNNRTTAMESGTQGASN